MNTPQRTSRRPLDGVLLLDKPLGLSSNAALQQAKRLYRAQKAGHTRTLDPATSGLLPICFSEAPKFAHALLEADKAYAAVVHLGTTTTTADAEGDITTQRPVEVSRDDIEVALARFVGHIAQTAPRYAALKYQGRNYYEYARKGIDIPRSARDVVITALTLDAWSEPDAHIRVRCSKGTYIRVLAEDLGEALGCGAHLAALRRTATGGFDLAKAHTLDRLAALDDAQRDALLLPTDALLSDLPRLELTASEALPFHQGQQIERHGVANGAYRAYAGGAFLGVATALDGSVRPRRLVAAHASARACDTLES